MRLYTSVLLPLLFRSAAAVNNGLALVPQMGWNNWNAVACNVSESLIIDTAKSMVYAGLRDVGYKYVVLDDCWSGGRGEDGYLFAHAEKFPHGMAYVADAVHDLGMLYGMYSSAGEMTCQRDAGSLDWEIQDATIFAKWGVDYLKYDNCYNRGRFGTPLISFQRYEAMWNAINATGRPMLYSLCNWGEDSTHAWGNAIANSWRMSGDVYDFFTRPDDLCSCDNAQNPACIAPGKHCSVLSIINKLAPFADRAKSGGWNDLDMLEVGNGGMTDDEYIAHFSLWAALKSPLLMGNDLRILDAKSLSILNNPAVIAISQDPHARPAFRIQRNQNVKKDKYGVGESQIWTGKLWGGDQVVVFLNAADEELEMEATLEEIFVRETGKPRQMQEEWDVWDLWKGRMTEDVAERVLKNGVSVLQDLGWWNVTEMSYEEGIKMGDSRLIGVKVGMVKALGSLKTTVRKHAAVIFRLRKPSREVVEFKRTGGVVKDEL